MSLFDRMMDRNMERAKKMQKKMLDMQEEIYNENGEQIERVNKRSAELSAKGTEIHYKAAASGIKDGLEDKPGKFCHKCGKKLDVEAKYCSECGAKVDVDLVEYVSKILKLSREETIKNSKVVEGGLTYYWNPARGGASLIINEKGDYLAAASSVSFERLLEEYKKGERVKNIFRMTQ